VIYVDIDAVAVAVATSILTGNERAVAIRADLRSPEALLTALVETGLVDLSEPVALLMVAVLHLIPDTDRPADAVKVLQAAIAPGSHLAISHLTSAGRPQETAELSSAVARRDGVSLVFRSRADIESFFGDFTLLAPGLTELSKWRPDPAELATGLAGSSLILAGLARKD
jgi:hypothetical protein